MKTIDMQEIYALINTLDDDFEKNVLSERVNGVSLGEIAERLGMSLTFVRQVERRAMRRLRSRYKLLKSI